MSEKIQYGIDPDEYVKNNPFMEYTNMKIEKISPECSEISMKITHGVTNLMGMVHGGTDGESRWKEVCDSERTCEFYPERIGGDCPCEGDPGPPWPYDHDRAE